MPAARPAAAAAAHQQRPRRWQPGVAALLVCLLALASLLAAFTAELLKEWQHSSAAATATAALGWRDYTLAVESVLAVAFLCTVVAPHLIHGVIGRRRHSHRGYAFFQPFVGGWKFIVLQIIGWSLYGAAVSSFTYVLYAVLQRIPIVSGAMVFSGFGGFTAQVVLFASLQYFEKKTDEDMTKSMVSFCITAILYSLPIILLLLIMLPFALLPLPIFLAMLSPLIYVYSHTYRERPHNTGSRSWPAFRNSSAWSYLEHYFQLKVVSNSTLDKDTTYMMGYHPHGIYPFTTFWATRGTQWRARFPQVDVDVLGASVLFYLPLIRDIAMWSGGRDVSRDSIRHAFKHGRSVMLVPGGEREMRETRPESKTIVLISRHKGFIRMALEHGVSLVPVFGFGESLLLDNFRAKRMQEWFAKRTFYGIPHMPYGRFYSPIPHAVPVTVAVGEPIPVPKVDTVTDEILNKYHRLYFDRLRELFDKHKQFVEGFKDRCIVYPDFGEHVGE